MATKEGISIAHYDLRYLKPLDEELLHEVGRQFKKVITVEDGVIKGGMGSAMHLNLCRTTIIIRM